ncbi:ankyrin repeat and SAM domain-containing protein 1A-like [Sphaerodactylus townsendi]|uniref:ankyrin repeat and SAM domain-containing protein 1A-like n=1 Tax=Sphaerodactylus townsendi TaxID=933632 RepID=UPI002025D41E|nr:ankyrin repeat and SAM domain-containing protein 1A-like [Sphaerodactylus townsendi]
MSAPAPPPPPPPLPRSGSLGGSAAGLGGRSGRPGAPHAGQAEPSMAVLKLAEQPLLVQAIFNGDPDEIRMLIYKTEDVNALDTEKRTPLHVAAFLGDAEIIELLILSVHGKAKTVMTVEFWSIKIPVSDTNQRMSLGCLQL